MSGSAARVPARQLGQLGVRLTQAPADDLGLLTQLANEVIFFRHRISTLSVDYDLIQLAGDQIRPDQIQANTGEQGYVRFERRAFELAVH